jgi:hypothetical protein
MLSQPLPHLRLNLFVISETFAMFLDPLVNRFALTPSAHNKRTTECCSSLVHSSSTVWLLKPACEHAHAHLLPRLCWSWNVLLPSDIYRKPITSITAVLLPFVTYLLTLPGNSAENACSSQSVRTVLNESDEYKLVTWLPPPQRGKKSWWLPFHSMRKNSF